MTSCVWRSNDRLLSLNKHQKRGSKSIARLYTASQRRRPGPHDCMLAAAVPPRVAPPEAMGSRKAKSVIAVRLCAAATMRQTIEHPVEAFFIGGSNHGTAFERPGS